MTLSEADTCRKYVVPKLQAAGWDDEPHSIAEQRSIADGRIVPVGKGFVRKPQQRPDYLLRHERNLWSKLGYAKTYRTPKTGDGGVDVVAMSGKAGVLIQCKSSSVDGKELGWDAVKDVVAGSAAYGAKHPGIEFKLVAATNKRFNGMARHQAKLNDVELLDSNDLTEWMREKPVRRGELSAFLLSGWGS